MGTDGRKGIYPRMATNSHEGKRGFLDRMNRINRMKRGIY
jgi:hypothetical protein